MPNWCDNTLIVKGEAKDLKDFLTKFKGKPANYPMTEYDFYVYSKDNERRPMTEEEKQEAIKKHQEEYENLTPDYCFNALYPVPQEVLDVGFDGHWREWRLNEIDNSLEEAMQLRNSLKTLDGYHWQSNNWGTKWDIYHDNISCSGEDLVEEALNNDEPDNEIEVVFGFMTAWGPCIGFINKVSKDFPTLDFTLQYFESGMCFAGEFIANNGNTINISYDLDTIEGKEFVRENFDDTFGLTCDECCETIEDCQCEVTKCPNNGDERNDCEGCVYSGEYHFVDGECVKREQEEQVIEIEIQTKLQ